MFDTQYRFYGSHAYKVNALNAVFDENSKAKLFDRNVDILVNAPIIGFLFHTKAERDNSTEYKDLTASVFNDRVIASSEDLKLILRLILLLDTENEPDEKKRMDRAFRSFGTSEDLALFDSYARGGVDILYSKLVEGTNNPDDYINNLSEFVSEFNERFNEQVKAKDILEKCR